MKQQEFADNLVTMLNNIVEFGIKQRKGIADMTYIPPERTPRQPERIPITNCFDNAQKAFTDMYGAINRGDAEYRITGKVYWMLLQSHDLVFPHYPLAHLLDKDKILTLWGVKVVVNNHIDGNKCVLIAGGNEYHFEIPEPRKVKRPTAPPPQPTLNMYPGWDKPSRLWQAILSFIDWLNRLPIFPSSEKWTAIDKPKHKTNGEQMATLDELFEGYEDTIFVANGILTVEEARELFGIRAGGGRTGQR